MAKIDVPDYTSRTVEGVGKIFRHFGVVEAPQLDSPLYEALSFGVAEDSALCEIASLAPAGQGPPNLLFGATHYLLLKGEQHPLRAFYPALTSPARPASEAFPHFRDFVLTHREPIERMISSRRVQTNVIQRTVCLVPAFGEVLRRNGDAPLALIEVGASAGLNLNWDVFSYEYLRKGEPVATWGPSGAKVHVDTEVRGDHDVPLPGGITVASRVGVDLNPISVDDEDSILWLRALIWPEHVARHERLAAAIAEARAHPYELIRGDALELLPGLMDAAPDGSHLVVYATIVLYQFSEEARHRLFALMETHSRKRPVTFVSMDAWGQPFSELTITRFEDGGRETTLLGHCSPHGRWLEWLV